VTLLILPRWRGDVAYMSGLTMACCASLLTQGCSRANFMRCQLFLRAVSAIFHALEFYQHKELECPEFDFSCETPSIMQQLHTSWSRPLTSECSKPSYISGRKQMLPIYSVTYLMHQVSSCDGIRPMVFTSSLGK
jgi:hypothetical protein